MACVWMVQLVVFLSLYTDLSKLEVNTDHHKSHEGSPVLRSSEGRKRGNTSRVDYDEDIYKEILANDSADRRSINSAGSSRSPYFDSDNLIETAEDFIVEGHQGSRSHTPNTHQNHDNPKNSNHTILTNNAQGQSGANSCKNVTIETDYGTFDGNSSLLGDEEQNSRGSQDYIYSRESSVVDFSHGKLRFMYQGKKC